VSRKKRRRCSRRWTTHRRRRCRSGSIAPRREPSADVCRQTGSRWRTGPVGASLTTPLQARMVMRAGSRWFLALCAVPSMLLAQESGGTIREGDRVRITAQSDTGVYIVRALTRDTLTVQLPKSEALVSFPVTTLRRVEVRRPDDSGTEIVRHGLTRGLGGVVLVGGMGAIIAGAPGALYGGAAGGAVGFLSAVSSGLLGRSERWERLSLPPRVSATVRGDAVFALSYSF
jgi:hypothetical protein